MKKETLSQAWLLFCRLDHTATLAKKNQTRLSELVVILSLTSAFTVCLAQFISQCLAPNPADVNKLNNAHNFDHWKQGLTAAAAVVSALSAFATTRIMHSKSEKSWQNIRSLTEQLKSEIYLFCTGFGKYYGLPEQKQDDVFNEWLNEIHTASEEFDLLEYIGSSSPPAIPLDVETYIRMRVKDQVTWYNNKSKYYDHLLKKFNYLMQSLTVAILILGVLNIFFVGSMWVAFFTTLISSVSAHMMASKYKELRRAYSVSAKQMIRLESNYSREKSIKKEAAERELAEKDIVEKSEAILRGENKSWQGMW